MIEKLDSCKIKILKAFREFSWSGAISRVFLLSVLLSILLSCSGCIFIRLSRVLVQMKEPERHLEVNLEQHPFKARWLHPIVLLSDVETLLSKRAIPEGDHVLLKFQKSGPQDREPWGIRLWVDSQQRITHFEMPKRLGLVLGNDFIMRAIEAVGRAEVSIGKRRIYMDLKAEVEESQVLSLMGRAMTEETTEGRFIQGGGRCLRYRFEDRGSFFHVQIHLSSKASGAEESSRRATRRLKSSPPSGPSTQEAKAQAGDGAPLNWWVSQVVLEANGYGLEVLVKSP